MVKMREVEKEAGDVKSPAAPQERVGIFMQGWKIVKSYGPSASNSHITSFRAGQLIFKGDEIDSLVAQGAPLRVYTRDAD